MANEDEKESKVEELYSWISGIPLSKPTKNLSRDFSDAVMMAEILKQYYPRHVDLHNYMPVNSLNLKKENWNILNRKVLSKIDMKLNKDAINQLANCHPGAAENILLMLKKRISKDAESNSTQDPSCNDKENEFIEENSKSKNKLKNPKECNCNVYKVHDISFR
ncbi:sperm flagellar protein 1-like [Ceratina calcarata]|uniref:Sperm flagellar protein 1-like n=1 Tax=Ceratina calcarata TaxID=156304 RepID=A0AAJ7S412_9HYME|nr:sperm flagellar protein 1-like [Ceratina calcarata]